MATIVAWVALAIAAVALGFVWKLNSELSVAARRLDRYNKALFDANDEIRRLREGVEENVAQLRVDVRSLQGTFSFAPDMTVREVLMVHPQAEQVLASFHLGGCSHCSVEPGERLADACREHGIDVQQVVGTLNLLTQGSSTRATENGTPALVKLPNVVLEFE